ncbi:hypothetical protein [Nonomuraea sp. NPDC049646]
MTVLIGGAVFATASLLHDPATFIQTWQQTHPLIALGGRYG